MSLQILAADLASKGRNEDTMLVHMTPNEVNSLQGLAMRHGGSLSINPETGLPEAGILSTLLPIIAGAGLSMIPGVGPLMAAGIVGAGSTILTGDLGKGFMAGLGAYGGASLAGSFGANAAGNVAKETAKQTAATTTAAARDLGAESLATMSTNPVGVAGVGQSAPTIAGAPSFKDAAMSQMSGLQSTAPSAWAGLNPVAEGAANVAKGSKWYKNPWIIGGGLLGAAALSGGQKGLPVPEQEKTPYGGPFKPVPRDTQFQSTPQLLADSSEYQYFTPEVSPLNSQGGAAPGYMPIPGQQQQYPYQPYPNFRGSARGGLMEAYAGGKQITLQNPVTIDPDPVGQVVVDRSGGMPAWDGVDVNAGATGEVSYESLNPTEAKPFEYSDRAMGWLGGKYGTDEAISKEMQGAYKDSGYGGNDAYTTEGYKDWVYDMMPTQGGTLPGQTNPQNIQGLQSPQRPASGSFGGWGLNFSTPSMGTAPPDYSNVNWQAGVEAPTQQSPYNYQGYGGYPTPTQAPVQAPQSPVQAPQSPGGKGVGASAPGGQLTGQSPLRNLRNLPPEMVDTNPNRAAPAGGRPPMQALRAMSGGNYGFAEGGLAQLDSGLVQLDDGSFIVDARTVSELGNGSSSAGIELLAQLGGVPIDGAGDGSSDSIPAVVGGEEEVRVAREEVMFSKEAVDNLGGAEALYALMDRATEARQKAQPGADTTQEIMRTAGMGGVL